LINNAGICDKTISTLQDITKENLMSHYETNVVAPVLLVKVFGFLVR
jgi:NAD(P)-dependent dehydrogenase (short-subunit alcohol dehydrogenase family)